MSLYKIKFAAILNLTAGKKIGKRIKEGRPFDYFCPLVFYDLPMAYTLLVSPVCSMSKCLIYKH